MAKIGYARVSSTTQNINRQIEKLNEHKVTKIFQDKLSGKTIERPALTDLLNYIRDDDVVIVTELDRLGRNNRDLTHIMTTIQSKGATLEILNLPTLQGIEDKNLRQLINSLMIELYKYQAEQERKNIRERQQAGIALAKHQGKYKGRKPLFDKNSEQLQHAFDLYKKGHSINQTAKMTGINRETLRRYIIKYI